MTDASAPAGKSGSSITELRRNRCFGIKFKNFFNTEKIAEPFFNFFRFCGTVCAIIRNNAVQHPVTVVAYLQGAAAQSEQPFFFRADISVIKSDFVSGFARNGNIGTGTSFDFNFSFNSGFALFKIFLNRGDIFRNLVSAKKQTYKIFYGADIAVLQSYFVCGKSVFSVHTVFSVPAVGSVAAVFSISTIGTAVTVHTV